MMVAVGMVSACAISQQQEVEIGAQQYGPSQQMQGGDYVVDPTVTAYVQSVGERLAQVSDRKLPYEFVVLNNSVPNAWALPGGKIAVNRGLLTELGSERNADRGDVYIRPAVDPYGIADFKAFDRLVELGREVGERVVDEWRATIL